MADQVSPTGGLAPGLPLALLVASAPRPAAEPARPAVASSQKPAGSTESGHGTSVEAAVSQVNAHLQQSGSELKFQVDQGTGHTVFKVVDPGDGKVLLQVPSAEMLAMARNLRAMDKQMGPSGALVDREG